MSRPKVYITGLAHSGTTWAWWLLRRFYDTGEELQFDQPRKGGEWKPAWRLAAEFAEAMGYVAGPRGGAGWNEATEAEKAAMLEEFRPRIEAMDWPELVKVPDYGHQTIFEAVRPDVLVVLERSRHGWVQSMRGNNYARRMSRGDLERAWQHGREQIRRAVERSGIPTAWLDFPSMARDWPYAWYELRLLGLDREALYEAWMEETKPKWLHRD